MLKGGGPKMWDFSFGKEIRTFLKIKGHINTSLQTYILKVDLSWFLTVENVILVIEIILSIQ